MTATLAHPRRVRRSPERSPRVSATLSRRTHPFKQTNVRTYIHKRHRGRDIAGRPGGVAIDIGIRTQVQVALDDINGNPWAASTPSRTLRTGAPTHPTPSERPRRRRAPAEAPRPFQRPRRKLAVQELKQRRPLRRHGRAGPVCRRALCDDDADASSSSAAAVRRAHGSAASGAATASETLKRAEADAGVRGCGGGSRRARR